jgi:hypothetical protein
MKAQPVVLIAMTDVEMAAGLTRRCGEICLREGLQLRTGSDENHLTFTSKEELFSVLQAQDPVQLCDWLVLLHIGTDVEECFKSAIDSRASPWHVSERPGTGVAIELMLRFPQVFPVFLASFVQSNPAFERWLQRWLIDAELSTDVLPDWHRLAFINTIDIDRISQLLTRFGGGLRTLFDPTGFRTLVRNRFLAQVFGSDTPNQGGWQNSARPRSLLNSRLRRFAVIVEEEIDVALLAAYSAYKLGARAWLVNSYQEFRCALVPSWRNQAGSEVTVIRDLDLRFADYPSRDSLDPSIRRQLRDVHSAPWQGLPAGCTVRVLSQELNVTQESDFWSQEDRRLGQHTRDDYTGVEYLGLQKPLRSLFAMSDLLNIQPPRSLVSSLGVADELGEQVAHGAPYQNLRIAQHLLSQAKECRAQHNVDANIVGALLAQEAYSLLLGMSRTSSLDAILETNLCEVRAEGESAGVTHEVQIGSRREDLETSTESLHAGEAGFNFLSKAWAELRLMYRETEQFGAAEEANAESLSYGHWIFRGHVDLFRATRIALKRFVLSFLRSLPRLFFLFLAWPIVLTAFYCWAYGWVFTPTVAGIVTFSDMYTHVFLGIVRGESLNVHGMGRGGPGETFLQGVVDILSGLSTLTFIGLIVTVVFRKSTRG